MKKKKNSTWFEDVVESKGAKEIEEIEHLLKMKDEEYRMQEDLELREAETSKSIFAKRKLENLKKQIDKNRFERDEEIRVRLAHYRKVKEDSKQEKYILIGCAIFLIVGMIYLNCSGRSESSENKVDSTPKTTITASKNTTTKTYEYSTSKPSSASTPEVVSTEETVYVAELSEDQLTYEEKELYDKT